MKTDQSAETKYFWAFITPVSKRPHGTSRRRYIITACSPRLKALGIRAGMPYGKAKRRLPGMRVIVCGS